MKKLLSVIFALLGCLTLYGQPAVLVQSYSTDTLMTRYALHSVYFSPEKLYLHVDRTAFCAGETIWFNGYLQNASSERLEAASNYIYVELTAPDGSIERRVKIRREGTSFPGCIFIPDDIEGGRFILKAYTLSQLDQSQDYYFHQDITIIGPEPAAKGAKAGKADKGIDVSFYPEGGRYFAGLPARIGVKAMDSRGRSVELSAFLADGSGNRLASFQTSHDGMGQLQFLPEEGEKYFLETGDGRRFPLPGASESGASISATGLSGRVMVRVSGKGEGVYSLLLRDISSMRKVADFSLGPQPRSFIIPREELSAGINHLLLLDSGGRMVSERLFFEYGSARPVLTLSGSAEALGMRDAASVQLSLTGADGSPLEGSCSVSVVGASLASCRQADGIDSYMLLSSELRGTINDPRWYFDPEVPLRERSQALDLLMLIQGWSYYDLGEIANPRKPLDLRKHAREFMQFIRGKVERTFSSKAPTDFRMTVLFPSLDKSRTVNVGQGKRFILDSLSFEEGNGVMIKISRGGGKLDYIPSWEGDEFAPEYVYASAPGSSDGVSGGAALELASTDTLRAAVISADASAAVLGIRGHTLPREDYKMFGSYTLIQYLRMKAPNFSFNGEQMRNTRTQMLDSYGLHNGGDDMWDESPVKLVVDGSVEPWVGFENVTISEIESISISNDPDPVYGAREGVVAIKLQYGTRVTHLSDTEPSLIYFTPLGYQSPQKFYAPRYDLGFSTTEADRRNTLFWEPQLQIRGGKAEFTFCTDDREKHAYVICVEGMSADGEPFSVSKAL